MGTNITGIGNANAIGFKSRVTGGTYFPPELKDALVGVWSAYGKSNDSTDRNIIKNKIKDRGGDFVISNAAFKLNSGFGKYEEDFTSWDRIDASTAEISNDGSKIKCINTILNVQYLFNSINKDIPSFKVKISNFTKGNIAYYYRKEDGTEAFLRIEPSPLDKVLELPKSYNTVEGGTGSRGGFYSSNINIGVTIEQIPSFEGAFVTDGIDDTIISTKTLAEMGITDEVTVVSMIHQISLNPTYNNGFTNYIENLDKSTYVRNNIYKAGKTGIYGYSASLINRTASNINDILGDKKDYGVEIINRQNTLNSTKFSVIGRASGITEVSSVAWYWTIIANKVLTTDQINQVIAYFNLDRTLKPDILCDVKKQGITNENHAEFGDKLIDYSGNGRDIQLNNIAWKGDSGIGKYVEDFTTWYGVTGVLQTFSKIEVTDGFKHNWVINRKSGESAINSFKVLIKGIPENGYIQYRYFESEDATKKSSIDIYEDGEYSLPNSTLNNLNDLVGFQLFAKIPPLDSQSFIGLTITQIPSHAGALCLDGINDFGKVTGMPVYKDYTVVTDREIFANIGAISSKNNPGAFVETAGSGVYSFGQATSGLNLISTRSISYLSKYSYCGQSITAGAAEDGTDMWLGTIRDNDTRFFNGAIYSLMSFPYSMSEFLIERQLKKHKLGTLYPDMVEFRPIVKSNSEYQVVDCYIDLFPAVVGNYYPINSKLRIAVTTKGAADEVTSLTVNGVSLGTPSVNGNRFTFNGTLSDKSPQKINITIDEYIRFEDIVQPYPLFFEFTDENGNLISWGGKAKVGSTITRTKGVNYANLLEGLFTVTNPRLNGVPLASAKHIVEKSMVFTCTATWAFDNNGPKCILSPRLLRIPNSSYKILGHIPDISGHGNHGVFNNFAFSKMSGADGYPYDYKSTSDFVAHARNAVLVNSETVKFINVSTQTSFYYKGTSYKGKIKVTGITKAIASGKVRYLDIYSNSPTNNDRVIIDKDGIYDVNIETEDAINIFFYLTPIVSGTTALDEPVYLEQVGNYEGSICFDGVDDYMDIPSLSIGGKQVLMKTNWLKSPTLLYDQRASGSFAILTTEEDGATNPRIAYQARNQDGKTYIDGIENNYIETYSLKGITHNITVTNPSAGSGVVPVIGANTGKSSSFAKMALYDFMLFDEVSTNEEIKQLNDIVGIEGGYVQKPPYYWDAYGKTNLDADKATIQQRGVAVGDYDLTNTNFTYDKMSGFGGYTLGKFTNSWSHSNNSIGIVARNPYDITLKKLGGNKDWEFNTTELKLISNPVSVKFKSDKNIRFTCDYHYYTVGGNSGGAPLGITSKDLIANEDTIITISPISQENIDKYNIDINRGYYLIYFKLSPTLAVNEEVTIEMLPLYPNGLVYDGVDDYSENTSIPAFTDYTYIIKYEDFNNPNTGSCIQRKGSIKAGGGAFVQDYIYRGTKYQYNFGINSNIHKDDSIAFCTKTNYNGTAIPSGNNTDDTGFTIGKFDGYRKMVFYKEMLYPRTVNMLTINMIKNMMAEDGIIDIQGKLFTDKFTGDFNLDFNKDFLIGN